MQARTHGANVWNVEAASCDVSGDEYACFIFGEFIQMLEALPLLQASMQGARGHIEQLKETRVRQCESRVVLVASSTRARRPRAPPHLQRCAERSDARHVIHEHNHAPWLSEQELVKRHVFLPLRALRLVPVMQKSFNRRQQRG